jgi:hypothetical protein
MDTEDIKKYRQILSEAWATELDKKRGLVRHGPKPADPEVSVDPVEILVGVDKFLSQAKFQEMSTVRHQLSIAISLIKDLQKRSPGGVFGASPPAK